MKKCVISCIAAVAALAAAAAPARSAVKTGGRAGPGADAKAVKGSAAKGMVRIEQFPRTGRQSTLRAPQIEGSSTIGNNVYNKAASRKWIVLEAKYSTFDNWTDQLNFTWHVLLDASTATEKDKEDKIAPYSYYTVTVPYMNIPKGTHAASVCLPPACLERFGEPKAIGIVVANKEGETIAGDVQSEIKGIKSHPKSIDEAFWNDKGIMEKENSAGERIVEQRQGLLDRSKTIWALVNPNDYEQVVQ